MFQEFLDKVNMSWDIFFTSVLRILCVSSCGSCTAARRAWVFRRRMHGTTRPNTPNPNTPAQWLATRPPDDHRTGLPRTRALRLSRPCGPKAPSRDKAGHRSILCQRHSNSWSTLNSISIIWKKKPESERERERRRDKKEVGNKTLLCFY
jgi:hypothetical protein